MLHKVTIERIYNLGNYQNIKITVESGEIPDEVWNDGERLTTVRDALHQEIVANLAQHLMTRDSTREALRTGDYQTLYEENA